MSIAALLTEPDLDRAGNATTGETNFHIIISFIYSYLWAICRLITGVLSQIVNWKNQPIKIDLHKQDILVYIIVKCFFPHNQLDNSAFNAYPVFPEVLCVRETVFR